MSIVPVSLLDENYAAVFKEVLKEGSLKNLAVLSFVCTHWYNVTERPEFGQWAFERVGIPTPETLGSWKRKYQMAIGLFFGGAPQVSRLRFPRQIDLKKGGVAWIENQGFIHYTCNQFQVCYFENLTEFQTVTTNDMITAMAVTGKRIVCGFLNGGVSVFSLGSLEFHGSFKAHEDSVLDIFPFHEGWISTSSESIAQWKHSGNVKTIFRHEHPLPDPEYSCFNNQLYFQNIEAVNLGFPLFSTVPFFYALDLHHPEKGVSKLNCFRRTSTQLLGWGDTIIFFNPINTFLHYDHVTPDHIYEHCHDFVDARESVMLQVIDNSASLTGARIKTSSCFFRENVTFIIYTNEKEDFIRFLGPKEEQSFRARERIATNDKGYICTIMDNSFLFFTQSHKLVRLDFPLPPQ